MFQDSGLVLGVEAIRVRVFCVSFRCFRSLGWCWGWRQLGLGFFAFLLETRFFFRPPFSHLHELFIVHPCMQTASKILKSPFCCLISKTTMYVNKIMVYF